MDALDMDETHEHPQVRPILANLGREIRRPLEDLRLGIERFLQGQPKVPEAERAQGQTMLAICEELDRLTRERLIDAARPTESD